MPATIEVNTKDRFLSLFELQDFSFDTDFSKNLRKQALNALTHLEFPTSKSEYWKYTRVNKTIKQEYKLSYPEGEIDIELSVPSENCLVFVNGYFSEELSWVQDGVDFTFCSLSEAKTNFSSIENHFGSLGKHQSEIFSAINTAYHQDGAFLYVPKNVQVKDSLYVLHIIDGEKSLSNPRNCFVVDSGGKANIVMKVLSAESENSFTNMVSEVIVKENAHFEINKIQDQTESDSQIISEEVYQEQNSRFKINTFCLNGGLIRNNLNIELQGQNTETWLNGLYPLKGKQHVDNHTYVLHRQPNCVSHELYKGILDDASTAVFNGKVYVHQDAQKTNAYQSNANMVLTDQASANSKPELEIYADDVKCSHGSVTGQLDEEAMFYLRSRGMSVESARAVLLNAYAADVIDHIGPESVKEEIESFINSRYKIS